MGDGAETAKEKKRCWDRSIDESECITVDDIDLDNDIILESFGNDSVDVGNVMLNQMHNQRDDTTPSKGTKRRLNTMTMKIFF